MNKFACIRVELKTFLMKAGEESRHVDATAGNTTHPSHPTPSPNLHSGAPGLDISEAPVY
jgi:hypothetical protein